MRFVLNLQAFQLFSNQLDDLSHYDFSNRTVTIEDNSVSASDYDDVRLDCGLNQSWPSPSVQRTPNSRANQSTNQLKYSRMLTKLEVKICEMQYHFESNMRMVSDKVDQMSNLIELCLLGMFGKDFVESIVDFVL